MEKTKKKSKTIVFAWVCLVFAFACCAAAFILGAGSKDNWESVAKKMRVSQGLHETPIAKTTSLDSDGISKAEFDVSGSFLTIKRHDSDEIIVDYFEDYSDEVVARVEGGKLVVSREFSYGSIMNFNVANGGILFNTGLEWWFMKDYYKITVLLPNSLSFDSCNIDVGGGTVTIEGGEFGKTDVEISGGTANIKDADFDSVDVDVSGGLAEFKGGSIRSTINIEVSGGSVKLSDCDVFYVSEIDVSGGLAELKECGSFSVGKVDVSGGTVYVSGAGLVGDVNVSISGGVVTFDKLINSKHTIGYNVRTSGGSAKLNGKSLGDNSTHSPSPSTMCITAKISGGRLVINTTDC